MVFLLNSSNVFDYLSQQGLFDFEGRQLEKVELIEAKNFNLLVTLPDGSKLLLKQERYQKEGQAISEFLGEWRSQEFFKISSELEILQDYLPQMLHFDSENLILVFKYLDDYQDLYNFYQESNFSPSISGEIGNFLSLLHRGTFQKRKCEDFWVNNQNQLAPEPVKYLIQGLGRISPEIFGFVPVDGLKFFILYQKYESLGQAISELGQAFQASCLTHNDLKINNILLHKDWQISEQNIIRIIDWERSRWGDPAFDLGIAISSYLQLWLNSLVISQSLSIEESLRLATTPLEKIQPSLASLIRVYLDNFPEILETRPDFLQRVIQFAGFGLIQQIQAMIQYQKTFGNMGIAMLQVAKSLLCRPQASIATVFGTTAIYSNRI